MCQWKPAHCCGHVPGTAIHEPQRHGGNGVPATAPSQGHVGPQRDVHSSISLFWQQGVFSLFGVSKFVIACWIFFVEQQGPQKIVLMPRNGHKPSNRRFLWDQVSLFNPRAGFGFCRYASYSSDSSSLGCTGMTPLPPPQPFPLVKQKP